MRSGKPQKRGIKEGMLQTRKSLSLHWFEVKPELTMKDFNIFNAIDRLQVEGDLFKGVLRKGIDLLKTIQKPETLF